MNRIMRYISPVPINVIIFFSLVYLTFLSSYIDGIANPLLFSLVIFLALLKRISFPSSLYLPALVYLIIIAITSFLSIDPNRSMIQLLYSGIIFVLFGFITGLCNKFGRLRIQIVVMVLTLGGLFMIFLWADFLNWFHNWKSIEPSSLYPTTGFRLNGGNIVAAYLNIILMIAVSAVFIQDSIALRFLLGVYSFSALALIFLSSSRGAWLALSIGLITIFLLVKRKGLFNFQNVVHERVMGKLPLIIILGIFGLIFILLMYHFILGVHPTHAPVAFISRSGFWLPAIHAFLDSPIWGNGPFTYASYYLMNSSIPPDTIYNHAHNSFLDVLVGSGLVGIFGLGWLIWKIIFEIYKFIRLTNEKTNLFFGISGLVGLITFGVHSFFDGLYLMPFAGWTMVILLSVTFSNITNQQVSTSIKRFIVPSLVVMIGFWGYSWSMHPYREAIELAKNQDYSRAITFFEEARNRNPHSAIIHQQLGLAYSILAERDNREYLNLAIASFTMAIQKDPRWALNYANLGSLYYSKNDMQNALVYFRKAASLAPDSAVYQLNLGLVYEKMGFETEASDAYIKAVRIRPDWFQSKFWQENEFRNRFQKENTKEMINRLINIEKRILSSDTFALKYIYLADNKLKTGDCVKSKQYISLASLAYFRSNEEKIDLDWLLAEWEASCKDDIFTAAEIGERIFFQDLENGIYGTGSFGNPVYAQTVFRIDAMKRDFVPQLFIILDTEKWDRRLDLLDNWFTAIGKPKSTIHNIREKVKYNSLDW